MLMGISHATDAFVEAEKPHALVRSFILTYEQHCFLAVLMEFVKEFMKKAWSQEIGDRRSWKLTASAVSVVSGPWSVARKA
jgi:hypothetical protein